MTMKRGRGPRRKLPLLLPPPLLRAPPRDAAPRDNSNKHRLVRTVAVGNLTPGTARAALDAVRAAAGKEGGASEAIEEIVHPVPEADVERAHLRRDGCGGGVAFVVYASVRAATAAVARLHGSKVSAAEAGDNGTKRRGKGNASAPSPSASTLAPEEAILWARQVSGEGALAKKWRVIIRNLSFSADEAALRAALSPAGFVWELNLPRKPDGRPRGFAFAAFTCRAHAERAIAVANGLEVGGKGRRRRLGRREGRVCRLRGGVREWRRYRRCCCCCWREQEGGGGEAGEEEARCGYCCCWCRR